ncbi:tape measure protein [Spirosoma sp. SC4-14]|uniref:tape measure protein n=1 Tax=Spirosoma sp. SC4-14 TaxID=3128900 RepID=UPI0030D29652
MLSQLEEAGDQWAESMVRSIKRIQSAQQQNAQQMQVLANQINSTSLTSPAASQQLAEQATQVNKLVTQAAQYQAALERLKTAQSANELSIADLTRLMKGLETEYKQLNPLQANYAQKQTELLGKIKQVSAAISAQTSVLKEAKKATDSVEGSIQHLKEQNESLRQVLARMPDAFDKQTGAINRNNKAALEMQQVILRNETVLRNVDTQLGRSRTAAEGYGVSLKGLAGSAAIAVGGIIGVSSALDAIKMSLSIISDMERIDASLKAVSKDTTDFRQTQEYLIGLANRLGLQYEVLARSYKGLKAATNGTALEGKATQQIFTGLVDAGAALKLSNDQIEGALMAVTQMMSKGKVQAEELRQQLGERLPGAIKLLADAMGVSESKLNKMMEQGELLAVDVLPKLAAQLDKTYGKDAQSNLESMSGGWNRMTNEVHLFLAAMNDNGAISATANNIQNMISDTIRGIRVAIQSNDWKTFWGALGYAATKYTPLPTIGKDAMQQVEINAKNQPVIDEFKTMTPAQRQARIGITQDNINRNQKRMNDDFSNTVFGGKKDQVQQQLNADKQLLEELKKAEIELVKKDEADKAQAEINAKRAAQAKKEAEAEKQEKEAHKREAARRKAEAEADRKLNQELANAKAENDVKLTDLSANKQDGLISEKEFIEQRKTLTIAGIEERQAILEKAGKKESDDYKKLTKEKIDAETQYKRDSLKLALSDSKSNTSSELAGLSSDKAEGIITEQQYVEKKHKVILQGIDDQMRILTDAGQQESKLAKDLNDQKLEADKDYFKERLKAQKTAWKTELDETATALKAVDNQLGDDYRERLLELTKYYDEKERRIQVDIASQRITPDVGEAKLHELYMNRLRAELQLTEEFYQKDRTLSNAVVDAKLAALERYKLEAGRTPAEIEAAEEQIRKLKKARDQEAADDKKRLDKEVADNAKQKSDEQTQHEIANAQRAVEKRQQLWQQGLQLADTIGQSIASISSVYSQKELDNLDKQKEAELALAGDNADAKAKIEEQYNKRKAEVQRKAAIQEREAALFSIAINTAQAVMSVLSTGGGAHYLDFGVTAGILSAFVTAAGIAQAAAVLAAPLPNFWVGTTSAPEGFANLAERGPEIRQKKDGSYQYYSKPTVDWLDQGDIIYTADQSKRLVDDWQKQEAARQSLQDSYLMEATTGRLQDGRREELRIVYAGGSQPSEETLYQAMGRALDERPEYITNIDVDGMSEGLRKGNHYREFREKRRRFF